MKLGLVYRDKFYYESEVLKFFLDEHYAGYIDSTGKKTKNGDYIHRPYFVYYDRITGEAHHIMLRIIRSAYDAYQDYPTAEKFKKDLTTIIEEAERTLYPFHKVLEIVFKT